jgi:hypothetical protein
MRNLHILFTPLKIYAVSLTILHLNKERVAYKLCTTLYYIILIALRFSFDLVPSYIRGSGRCQILCRRRTRSINNDDGFLTSAAHDETW